MDSWCDNKSKAFSSRLNLDYNINPQCLKSQALFFKRKTQALINDQNCNKNRQNYYSHFYKMTFQIEVYVARKSTTRQVHVSLPCEREDKCARCMYTTSSVRSTYSMSNSSPKLDVKFSQC